MKRFLTAEPEGERLHRVSIDLSADAVARGALVSPIFAAFGGELPTVDPDGVVAFLFAAAPPRLLARVENECSAEVRASTFVSYGLASVGIVGSSDTLRAVMDCVEHQLLAVEVWQLTGGNVREDEVAVTVFQTSKVGSECPELSSDGLPYEVACQVRQLQANLQLALYRAHHFAPETTPGLLRVANSGARLVGTLHQVAGETPTLDSVSLHHYLLSSLLELNAALSLVISQTLGGNPPLLNSEYPVAEYGLLGVGTACRGLWGLYEHLRGAIDHENHIEKARTLYPATAAFDPFLNWQHLSYHSWAACPARVTQLPSVEPGLDSAHLVHFSSRFGFHETAYTLGASWQSLHASSSQEWHLLTVTHEFLHAYVRRLTAVLFPDISAYEAVSQIMRGERLPSNAMESMQVALTLATLRYAAAQAEARDADPSFGGFTGEGYNARPSVQQVRAALDLDLRQVQEVVVHVLDYLYTFAADDVEYISAIWQSWSTVPSVTERIHEYLLRTLCALAARSIDVDRDEEPVFQDVYRRTHDCLTKLSEEFDSPVLDAALAYLSDEVHAFRLRLEFSQGYYITRVTDTFLYDESIGFQLRRDASTTSGIDDQRLYAINPGEYPDQPVGSPLAFLADRFRSGNRLASDELEYASLWQLLMITNTENEEMV